MTAAGTKPSVFAAGLPTLTYDLTDTPQQIDPQFRDPAGDSPVRTRHHRGSLGEFDDYIDEMAADRRRHLTDDLLSELIRIEDAGDRLDAAELRMPAFSILIAGTDTTLSQLSTSMQVLGDRPDQWALLRDQLKILSQRLPNPRRTGSPPWKPLLVMSGTTSLSIDFDAE